MEFLSTSPGPVDFPLHICLFLTSQQHLVPTLEAYIPTPADFSLPLLPVLAQPLWPHC